MTKILYLLVLSLAAVLPVHGAWFQNNHESLPVYINVYTLERSPTLINSHVLICNQCVYIDITKSVCLELRLGSQETVTNKVLETNFFISPLQNKHSFSIYVNYLDDWSRYPTSLLDVVEIFDPHSHPADPEEVDASNDSDRSSTSCDET